MSKSKNKLYNDDGNIFGSNDNNKIKKQKYVGVLKKKVNPGIMLFLSVFLFFIAQIIESNAKGLEGLSGLGLVPVIIPIYVASLVCFFAFITSSMSYINKK